MDSDYTEYFKAFTPHTSQDGLAPESNGADGQDPEQLQGAQESQRSVELHNAGSDDRMSPTSATILTIVELQAQAMKNQRRNRQGSWPIVD